MRLSTDITYILSETQMLKNHYKALESDPFKSPPAQQHFATVLDFDWIQKTFLS